MKPTNSILFLLVIILSITNCKKDSTTSPTGGGGGGNSPAGYVCNNGTCVGVTDINNAQYTNLADCQSACGIAPAAGTVKIKIYWSSGGSSCNVAWIVTCGLGYNSIDVANSAYFTSLTYTTLTSNHEFSFPNLAPGIYYYKAKKTYNQSACGGSISNFPSNEHLGSFTIVSGQTTNINFSL